MKTIRKRFSQIVYLSILSFCISCSTTYVPTESSKDMDVLQARNALATELTTNESRVVLGNVGHDVTEVRISRNKLILLSSLGKKIVFVFSDLPQIAMEESIGLLYNGVLLDGKRVFLVKYPGSHQVMNALYVLKQNAINKNKNDQEFDSRFTVSLDDNRKKAATNVALPEEANRFKVQAEGALKDKAFYVASEYYAQALKIAPWWAAGYFNNALILSEIGDYEMAIREMKFYLQLVPNAKNARAAQNKIYDWERMDSSK